ncbi:MULTISPECIES: putative O-glycosylation ligase, exosortase A system-associated [unclassified Arsukibacterium]|uniref:putative O-glycosylation ligase, exosortase A system-associated n=1 Tax=unclassified Arsukibacterium TaxID=2635278 RepID=UPI000C8EE3A1|nr:MULTISPECIES: putative O-glycosylation ligase, exosortase A system-associated [unclassified Arsukibacterium]MAA94371.1 putative O-glycosylation ligase, exosortase A system-associated [Rheinheimera sp.]HAW91689.1 putative O-glycosylation ligase, exosortase A system-associated [Candidatus Azambacteria bacterium]|tara:strand:+ start:448 stop:1800 length:1353 start_codon:yes stop_codon:yes gene_type:complete
MRDIVLFLIIVGCIPFILRRPFFGVLVWCWISYMVPHRLGWGFIQTLPVASVIGLVFLVSYLFSKEPKKIPLHSPIVFLLLFNIWMVITFIMSVKDPYVISQFEKIMKIQFMTLVVLAMLTTRQRIEQALWVVALSIGFYGVKGGIYTIATAGGGRVWGPTGGFFFGNNELALTLLMILPILFYLRHLVPDNKRLLRLSLLAAMGLIVLAALGTQSRGGLVACVAVGFFLWLKGPNKLAIALVILIAAPVVYQFMPDRWHDRMATIIEPDRESYDGSVKGRFNAWEMAFNMAQDKPFGGGLNGFKFENFYLYAPEPERKHDSHSIYFQVMGHHGFVGFFLWFAIYLSTWRSAKKTITLTNKRDDLKWAALLAKMLQCSLIAYAAGGAFLGLAYFDLPYHLVITVVALNVVVNRQLTREADEKKTLKSSQLADSRPHHPDSLKAVLRGRND